MQTTLEQARKSKPKAVALASACASVSVVGAGLTKIGDSYAVKVNLRDCVGSPDQLTAQEQLPRSVDGVKVVYEVVGPVVLRRSNRAVAS